MLLFILFDLNICLSVVLRQCTMALVRPVFCLQAAGPLVAVLQGGGGALKLLPEACGLPLPLPLLTPLAVQLTLEGLLLLLQPRDLQQCLVTGPCRRLGLQARLSQLALQLLLATPR